MSRPFEMSADNMALPQVKSKQIEEIQSAKRKAEEQLRLLELQERSIQMGASREEVESISTRLNRMSMNGPVSEPTTPPEYADSFSNRYSRSSRLSGNSIMSPPGLGKRTSQTSSQIASPAAGRLSGSMYNQSQKPSAKSMPGSRRGSDEEEDYAEDLPTIRPVTGYVPLRLLPLHLFSPHFPFRSVLTQVLSWHYLINRSESTLLDLFTTCSLGSLHPLAFNFF
jgi:hypothetical protein